MTPAGWAFATLATAVTAIWLALYRLPLRDPRTRQRVRLSVSSATGLPARYVFPIVGTAIYLITGALAAVALTLAGEVPLAEVLRWHVTPLGVAVTLLAMVGASALTAFAMSLVYAVRPTVDVPAAVTGVRWVQEIAVLPRRWRWIVPMTSAAIEEFFFRGVFLTGLLAAGSSVWAAIAVSGVVFTAGQVLLTEQRLQALVLAVSSVVLAVVCGLLVVVEGSVLPAILVHASFAGYYTNSSMRAGASTARPTANLPR